MPSGCERCRVAVIGAGPYGLAVGAHLRGAGLAVRVFGKPMDFWHSQMPVGMLLRSPIGGTSISDPDGAYRLERFLAMQQDPRPKLLPMEDLVRYGQWFQRALLPDVDSRDVAQVRRSDKGFDIALEDGERLTCSEVVVAAGIGSFARRPALFAPLRGELVSHTCDRMNRDLGRFAGKRVGIIGCGQSALESAALLCEAGSEVTVISRKPRIRFLRNSSWLEWLIDCKLNPFRAPGKIGPIGINWLVEHPRLFTAFPRRWQERMSTRAIRPAGSSWLKPRVAPVRFKTGLHVTAVRPAASSVRLALSDNEQLEVDHVLLATGYAIDIARYGFLEPELNQPVRTANGYPVLDRGFQASVPGLYFVANQVGSAKTRTVPPRDPNHGRR